MRFVLVAGLLGGLLLLGALGPSQSTPLAAQAATPDAAACPETTPDDNKALMIRWYELLSAGDWESVAVLAADDVVYHDASPAEESQVGGTGEWASERLQDYPDLQISIEQIVAEDDLVALYLRYAGTQQGDVEEEQGVPATGRQNEWVGMSLVRIECGKVAEIWNVADNLGRLQNLGVITPDELRSAEPAATPAP